MDQDATWYEDRPSAMAPNFRNMCIVAKRLDGSRCHLVRRGRPRAAQAHCVRWGPLSALPLAPKRGTTFPEFSAHIYCGQTVDHLSYC